MTFKHKREIEKTLPDLRTVNIERKRHYITPEGETYPSVTTVLSILSRDGIERWKKSVGEDVAAYEARRAAERGNTYHSIVADHLQNIPTHGYRNKVLAMALFERSRKKIERINCVYAQEKTLYSREFGIAGRVDCIAEYDGVLSVIDFKTSNRPKKEEWAENHFLQETAYSLMWEEQTSMPVGQIVTIIASEQGTVQVFIKSRDQYVQKLRDCVTRFNYDFGQRSVQH